MKCKETEVDQPAYGHLTLAASDRPVEVVSLSRSIGVRETVQNSYSTPTAANEPKLTSGFPPWNPFNGKDSHRKNV
jgi:hypothetical protein